MSRGVATAAARLIVKLRWLVVGAWVTAAVVLTLALPNIGDAQTGALGDLVPSQSDALDAELRSADLFRFPLLSRTLVVQRDPRGLTPREQVRVLARAEAVSRDGVPGLERIGGALPILNSFGKPPFSRESSTTAVTISTSAPMSIPTRGRSSQGNSRAGGQRRRPAMPSWA